MVFHLVFLFFYVFYLYLLFIFYLFIYFIFWIETIYGLVVEALGVIVCGFQNCCNGKEWCDGGGVV